MAKELPYFRFTASEWLNDDISLESYIHKGVFIDVCAFYWANDCDLTLEKLKKKCSNATNLLTDLITVGIIKHENKHDKIRIDFLDLQYDLLSEKRKLRQSAGSKGGNAKAKLKQKPSYKDKDNNKDKDKDKYDFVSALFYDSFFKWMKYKSQRNEKYKSIDSEKAFYNKLIKLSNNNPQLAAEIIEHSMASNYAGIFELKKPQKIAQQGGMVR